MKTLTKKVLKTLIKESFDQSKYFPEKAKLLIDTAQDLGFDELAEELIRESF